jgi:hypothetical protein
MAIHTRAPGRPLALLLAWLAAAACVPTTAAYLSLPLATEDRAPREHAVVRVPFAELRERMPGFDPAALAFYAQGRAPIPHRLLDEDGDGAPDAALVALPIAGDGSTRLIALCPGPSTAAEPPTGPPSAGVIADFARADH